MKDLYIDFDGVIYNSIDVSYKIAEEDFPLSLEAQIE